MNLFSKFKNKLNKKANVSANTETQTNTQTNTQANANELLKKQQSSNEKLNKLLEQSLSAISCGPDCQKEKTTTDLKQKYLNAQTNIQTAPVQLETTKKNYYVFSKGQPYYDNMLEQELNQKAKIMGEMLTTNFNEEISNASLMNSYYNTELTNSAYTKELYLVYLEKNQQIQKEIKEHHSDVLTNDRKTYYETEALEDLKYWYNFFWYIYYLFVMPIFTFALVTNSSYHLLFKILIEFIVFVYPYYIDFIFRQTYDFFYSIWMQLPKNVYNNL
jgi:hypothetical protein